MAAQIFKILLALLSVACGTQHKGWVPPGSSDVLPLPVCGSDDSTLEFVRPPECCWAGQRAVGDEGWPRCVGAPQCPAGMVEWGERCFSVEDAARLGVCLDPKLCRDAALPPAAPPELDCSAGTIWDGESKHCCWPGQVAVWTACRGTPLCPAGRIASGEQCLVIDPVLQREVELCLDQPGCDAQRKLERSGPEKVNAIRREVTERACRRGSLVACHQDAIFFNDEKNPYGERYGSADALWENCEAGYASSCTILGRTLSVWSDFAEDPQLGAALMRRGCELGDGEACVALGQAYLDGWEVEHNPEQAAEIFALGCSQGDPPSCEAWGLCLARGIGVQENTEQAISVLHDACEQGGTRVACSQARMLQNQSGPTGRFFEQLFLDGGGRGFFPISLALGYHWLSEWGAGGAASQLPMALRFGLLGPVFIEVGLSPTRWGGELSGRDETQFVIGAGAVLFSWSMRLRTTLFEQLDFAYLEPVIAMRAYLGDSEGARFLLLGNRFALAQSDDDFGLRVFFEPAWSMAFDKPGSGFVLGFGVEFVPRSALGN
ncbi:MAG: tetratricopeptide repeat protein [Myxococcota bacterium]|nr:tetratricopeptide repeat protein [Myxococcota bacterium]